MLQRIAKCGCDCFNCPTHRDNLNTQEKRTACSMGWEKHLGIKLSPEKLRKCDGCSLPNAERINYYLNCKVRKCAMDNGFDNCAACKGYPCSELKEVHSLQNISGREDFIERTGRDINRQDFDQFVAPYMGLAHLHQIRNAMSKADIKAFKTYSMTPAFTSPAKNRDFDASFASLYTMLTSIYASDNISYARLLTLKEKRMKLLKVLWVLGNHGNYSREKRSLEMDSKSFLSHKVISNYHTATLLFREVIKLNVQLDIIPQPGKTWLTPKGALRKEGWKIRLTLGKNGAEIQILMLFKKYVSKLLIAYGSNGFRHFQKVDMQVLSVINK